MDTYADGIQIVRLIFQRSLAAVYLIAFISALNQFPALLGENGLLPVPAFIRQVPFREAPSLFYFSYSDRLFAVLAWTGIVLSLAALSGISEKGSWGVSAGVWLVMWGLYLSIVNVGQTFYSFGWESMLLEAGFFSAFLGSSLFAPSLIPVFILRWMLFRTELGAGLIKLRYDQCWRDLTCLFYHYETQPLPNPLSWYFHHLPKFFQMSSVLFSHFVQVIAPFGLFAAQPVAAICGGLIIFHQLWLIISGNYSWLNWLTVILGVSAFSDAIIKKFLPFTLPPAAARPPGFDGVLYALAVLTLVLSVQPALNLLSRNQLMNYNYNPLQLVNSYGAFGSMSKQRYEVVIEGTEESSLSPRTKWEEYGFKAKPGDLKRMPPQIAPYHLRLDWLMWFIPFSVNVEGGRISIPGYDLWFLRFMEKLLQGDKATLKLLGTNPFPGSPPKFVRARYYLYRYTGWKEKQATGAWWKRTFIADYLPPVNLTGLGEL